VNPGALDSCSFWLTRRVVLQVVERLTPRLDASSPAAQRAPGEYRTEVVALERQAALASTASAMSQTPEEILRPHVGAAELAIAINFSDHADRVRVELHGQRGGQAGGLLDRAQLQRMLQMFFDEARKAQWITVAPAVPPVEPAAAARRLN
jgi:hypothetical protein